MRYLKVLLFLVFAILSQTSLAQEIEIKSFDANLYDLEARKSETMREDSANHQVCALIKVQLAIPHAQFEGHIVGEVIEKPGEYKVYLRAGAKRLKVLVPGYNPCEVSFIEYKIDGVQSKTVYKLVLNANVVAPKTQVVEIHAKPSTAMVFLSDEPLTLSDGIASKVLPFGTYKYRVEAEGYETQEGQISHYDAEKPTIVNITLKKISPSVSSTAIGTNTGSTTSSTPVKIKSKYKPTSFYLDGKFQVGMMMGAGASFGAYINNFNAEGTFLLGLTESEEIAWRDKKQTSNYGYTYTYKPMFYGLKLGYGIACGTSFRITPQLGVGVSSISGTEVQKGNGADPDATSCYAVPASVGARFEYYITNNFGLSASPEFGFAVTKSDTYTKLSELSSKVKGFGTGFNARIGLFVSF